MTDRLGTDGLPATFEVKLVHAFDVRINFHRRIIAGVHASGSKIGYVSLKDGIIRGPRLNGRVMEFSGADWSMVRADNVVESDSHYILEADDGAVIQIHNRGYIYNTLPNSPGPAYFRCTPIFRAPVGPHDWLNRTIIVGGGERHTDPDYTIFRYYAAE